jgi:hypothetical protein
MKAPSAGDFTEIMKYDARAGRLFRMDYDPNTRERIAVDITTPAPKFAMDFGSLEVGYVHFAPTGPDFRMVAEGQPLPEQPSDKDAEGKLKFKPGIRVKTYGKILLSPPRTSALREFASAANVVLEAVENLHHRFLAAAEAQAGQIPIVELTRTIPVIMGKGTRQSTVYTPCFTIAGWTDRVAEMGPRTVAPPLGAARTSAAPVAAARDLESQGVTTIRPLPTTSGGGAIENDEMPFTHCWQ